MATWVIIAALATIGVTALLIGLLHRINAPRGPKRQGGDGGEAGVIIDAGDGGGDGGGD